MTTRAERVQRCDNIELICGLVAAMSAITVALGLFIPSYLLHNVSSRVLLLVAVAPLPSVIFGVATLLHVRTHRRSVLLGMVIGGSINNTLIALPSVGLIYFLASIQESAGLVFLMVNFWSVLMTLAAALVGSYPFREVAQPLSQR